MYNYIDYQCSNLYYNSYPQIMFIQPYFHPFQLNQELIGGNTFYVINEKYIEQSVSSKPLFSKHKNEEESERIKETEQQLKIQSKRIVENQEQSLIKKVKNRNVLPNNLNLILSYIRRINKSGSVVKRIIDKYDQSGTCTVKKFYAYESYLKDKIVNSRSKQSLKEITNHLDKQSTIFSCEEQQFYNKVCRILITFFLKDQYILGLLTSSKIQKTCKGDHLKIQRYLILKMRKEINEPRN